MSLNSQYYPLLEIVLGKSSIGIDWSALGSYNFVYAIGGREGVGTLPLLGAGQSVSQLQIYTFKVQLLYI